MDTLVPDALWAEIAPLLPPKSEKPQGGDPRARHREALTGINHGIIDWYKCPSKSDEQLLI